MKCNDCPSYIKITPYQEGPHVRATTQRHIHMLAERSQWRLGLGPRGKRGYRARGSNGGFEDPRLTKNSGFKERCSVYFSLSEQAGCSDNDLGPDLFGLYCQGQQCPRTGPVCGAMISGFGQSISCSLVSSSPQSPLLV